MVTFRYKKYTVRTQRVEDPVDSRDPRPRDKIGTILILSRNYVVGDVPLADPDEQQAYWDKIRASIISRFRVRRQRRPSESEIQSCLVRLPIYVIEHGDRVYGLESFHCPWDSWQTGEIYARIDLLRKGGVIPTEDEVKQRLRREFQLWKYFVEGNIYEYCIERHGENVTGQSGYYGDDCLQAMKKDAKRVIDELESKSASIS